MDRLIAHLDMDAFYAAVEALDNPELKGKPVIVGGTSNRGVVSSASYEARRLGVRSAMPIVEARRKCPDGVFLPGRMKRYQEVSRKIMTALRDFAPVVEPVSIDEAFLDLTGTTKLYGPPEAIGRRLKALIRETTGLTCSVGLAPNKLVAKIASDHDKPDGLTVVSPEAVEDFLGRLEVGRLPGVGPRLKAKLELLSVATVADLRRLSLEDLNRLFGVHGARLHDMARGIDAAPVTAGRERPKSISAEQTLEADAYTSDELIPLLAAQALRVGRRLRAHGLYARTVVLKIKHADFKLVTRSQTLAAATASTKVILATATELLKAYGSRGPIRLVGLGVTNLESPTESQADLFGPDDDELRSARVDRAVDRILSRFGSKSIKIGVSLKKD